MVARSQVIRLSAYVDGDISNDNTVVSEAEFVRAKLRLHGNVIKIP